MSHVALLERHHAINDLIHEAWERRLITEEDHNHAQMENALLEGLEDAITGHPTNFHEGYMRTLYRYGYRFGIHRFAHPAAKRGGRIHAFGNGGSLISDEDYTEINRQRAINARVHERVQEIEERVKAREKEIEELVLAKTMHLLKRREAWQKKISETEGKHHHLREAYMKSQRDNERLAGMKDRSRRELKMQVEDLEHGLPGQPIKVEMDRKGMFVDDDKTRLHKKQGGRIRHKRFI